MNSPSLSVAGASFPLEPALTGYPPIQKKTGEGKGVTKDCIYGPSLVTHSNSMMPGLCSKYLDAIIPEGTP